MSLAFVFFGLWCVALGWCLGFYSYEPIRNRFRKMILEELEAAREEEQR